MSTAEARSIPRPASGVGANAVLALIALAQFMVVLDATIVNVALPTIKVDVGFSEQSLSWVLNAYTLIFGGFLLLGGRAATGSDDAGCSWRESRCFPAPPCCVGSRSPRACCLSPGDCKGSVARWSRRQPSRSSSPLFPRAGPQPRAGRLGRDRRRWRRHRAAPRRCDRRGAELALGLLRQCADRRRRAGAGSKDRAGEPFRAGLEGGYDVEGAVASTLGTITLVFTLIKADSWGWTSGRTLAGSPSPPR